MLAPILAALLPQSSEPPASAASEPVVVSLQPGEEGSGVRLRWSPKGASVSLTADGDSARTGSFALGPAGTPPVKVRLERSEGSEHFDRLSVDRDRDGAFGPDELLTCEPRLTRHKWWSSFETVVQVPVPGDRGAPAHRPYPMSLWFVVDPREEQSWPELRWSRRGFHVGSCTIAGEPAHVLVTESNMDGVFSSDDAWRLARDPAELGGGSTPLSSHCWLDGTAWRVQSFDPHGRSITIESFDPGFTEAEEKARRERRSPDEDAPRADEPLAFGHDLAAALAQAKRDGRKVFVDFETTWCGPCKLMDRLVYTSKAVVDAAARAEVVCVKLDGDDEFDLVKKYEVTAYPTMLLLDAEGKVVAREVGYRSVAQMAAFLDQ